MPATDVMVTKVRVLIETVVIVEPGYNPSRTPEENMRFLERWAKELMEFFRDHRSMDVNAVYANPTYQEQCSGCHREWDEMFDEESGKTCCAWCGVPIKVVT